MKLQPRCLLIFASLLLAFPVQSPAADLKTSSATKLRLFPENSAEVVARIESGSPVTLLQESGSWVLVQVQTSPGNYAKGWIPRSDLGTTPQESIAKDTPSNADDYTATSDPGYSFVFPTALQLRQGTKQARGLYFLGWELNYTIAEKTMIGGRVLAPIGVLAGGFQVKQSLSVSDKFHLAIFGVVGGIASIFSNRDNQSGYFFTGGAMTTVGDQNAAVTAGGYIVGGKGNSYGHAYLLNINGFYRITQRFKLILDAFTPIATHKKSIFGDWTALSYGIRYGGTDLSGDIGFIAPIYDDAGDFYKYVPLGIPFVTFNIIF